MQMSIMFNRNIVDRDPRQGVNEYTVFTIGKTIRNFEASPQVAERYARRYGMTHASPMDFWRDVVCT